jgi:hypothetical protein
MVWYNLKIGNWNLKYTPLNPIEKEYPLCDENGKLLERVSGKIDKGHYLNENKEKVNIAFRLINNKPYSKLSKTKEVNIYKEVELNEVEDLLQEKVYLVESSSLLNELITTGKALKFGFTNGNGFKVFKAYIYPSKIYKGYLFMSLGRTQISELITEIDEIKEQQKKLSDITLSITGINQAKVEDLMEL